jgi:hypothetical protein
MFYSEIETANEGIAPIRPKLCSSQNRFRKKKRKKIMKGEDMSARDKLLGYLNKAERLFKQGDFVSFNHNGKEHIGRVAHHLGGDGHYFVHAGREEPFKVHHSELQPSSLDDYKNHMKIKMDTEKLLGKILKEKKVHKSESPREELLEWMEKSAIGMSAAWKNKKPRKYSMAPTDEEKEISRMNAAWKNKKPRKYSIKKSDELREWLSKAKKKMKQTHH